MVKVAYKICIVRPTGLRSLKVSLIWIQIRNFCPTLLYLAVKLFITHLSDSWGGVQGFSGLVREAKRNEPFRSTAHYNSVELLRCYSINLTHCRLMFSSVLLHVDTSRPSISRRTWEKLQTLEEGLLTYVWSTNAVLVIRNDEQCHC